MVKGIANAFDHNMEFCFVITSTDGKWAVIWPLFLLLSMLILLPTFAPGRSSCCLQNKLVSAIAEEVAHVIDPGEAARNELSSL